MAWIPLNQSVFTHRKTMVLAEALDIPEVYAVGHLASLWSWCMDNAPDGTMANVTPRIIARAAQWPGQPADFLAALLDSGYLEESQAGYLIPNWMEYGGKVLKTLSRSCEYRAFQQEVFERDGFACVLRFSAKPHSRPCNPSISRGSTHAR